MARKKTAEELIAAAKKQMEKAKLLEMKELASIGIKVKNIAKSKNVTVEEFIESLKDN